MPMPTLGVGAVSQTPTVPLNHGNYVMHSQSMDGMRESFVPPLMAGHDPEATIPVLKPGPCSKVRGVSAQVKPGPPRK